MITLSKLIISLSVVCVSASAIQGAALAASPQVRGSSTAPDINDYSSAKISQMKRTGDDVTSSADIPDLRLGAVREAAMGLGMRNGLVARSVQINRGFLVDNKAMLNRIFKFESLKMGCAKEQVAHLRAKVIGEAPIENCMIIPPVILGAKDSLSDARGEGQTLRYSKARFKIKSQARLATNMPIWETYLVFNAGEPENDVHPTLYPRTSAERLAWDSALQDGWKQGVKQADSIFHQNLALLWQDFVGMQRYRYLLVQNLVTAPFVARNRMGVTGNSKDGISIDDTILSITESPEFNLKTQDWTLFPNF